MPVDFSLWFSDYMYTMREKWDSTQLVLFFSAQQITLKFSGLNNNKYVLYLRVSSGQEFGRDLVGSVWWLWLEVLMKQRQNASWTSSHLNKVVPLTWSANSWWLLSHGLHRAPLECFYNVAATFSRVNNLREQGKSCNVFYEHQILPFPQYPAGHTSALFCARDNYTRA